MTPPRPPLRLLLLLLLRAALRLPPLPFPPGGALAYQRSNVFHFKLYGASVLSGYPADPDGYGTAKLTFDTQMETVSFEFTLCRISEPGQIDISLGDEDHGDQCQILDLMVDSDVQVTCIDGGGSSGSEGGYDVKGCRHIDDGDLQSILSYPENYHVTVFNREYPYGALRGQLQLEDTGVQVSYSDANRNRESNP
eukprot:SM000491S17364  [mRNA]  locus=s491:4941:6273:+ [translate_table: standard]